MHNMDSGAALEELQTAEQIELMNAIDLLRSHDLNKKLDLPQLIVCGNQSSGKSSVLEAISGLPFPTGHGLVTKFATEFALRSASHESIRATIEPGVNTSGLHRKDLQIKSQDLQALADRGGDLPAIMNLASEYMKPLNEGSNFSPHRLRVQISGPHKHDLTFVDLPGLIAYTTQSKCAEDVKVVRDMVESYMRQPGSIILAVTPACVDPETQEVFQLAKLADEDGCRTMGILTKPDMAQRGAEHSFIELLQNEKINLRLGWHVLKNPNSAEESLGPRDEQEASFFADTYPWNTLPGNVRGIGTLKKRLRENLFEKICRSLPALVENIDIQGLNCEQQLSTLGPPRSGRDERLQYMEKLCINVNSLVREGIDASYESAFFRDDAAKNDAKLLCTNLQHLNHKFSFNMTQLGIKYHVVSAPSHMCQEHNREVLTGGVSLTSAGPPKCVTRAAMLEAITTHVAKYRGPQLPDEFPERTMREVFKLVSSSWEPYARQHAKQCLQAAQRFLYLVITEVAPTSARQIIDEFVAPQFRVCEAQLKEKITEILSPYQKLRPATYNPAYTCRVSELQECSDALIHTSPSGMAAQTTLNRMIAYYEISVATFVDNMATLAIENCVVEPLKSMVTFGAIHALARSEPETFDRITAEPKDIESRREELEKQLQTFNSVREVCNKHLYYQAERVTIKVDGAGIGGVDGLNGAYPSVIVSPNIEMPREEDPSSLFATSGDPAALTPPRTPANKPRPLVRMRSRRSFSRATLKKDVITDSSERGILGNDRRPQFSVPSGSDSEL